MRKLYFFSSFFFLFFFSGDVLQAGDFSIGTYPKIIELSDVTISCEAYEKYYRDLFEAAASSKGAYSHAVIELNEKFGTYQSGRIISNSQILSKNGLSLPTHKNLKNIECTVRYKDEKVYAGNLNGKEMYETVKVAYFDRQNTTVKIRNGYIDQCDVWVAHTMKMEMDDCGTGKIVRYFDVKTQCGKYPYTMKFSQTIHIVSTCNFSDAVLEVPKTQTMCGPIKFLNNNQVDLPKDVRMVRLRGGWTSTCGKSTIIESFKDQVFKISGMDRQYLIVRTWTFQDYCSGKKLSAEQKFRIDDTCGDPDPKPDPDPEPEPDDKDVFEVLSKLGDLEISQEKYEMIYEEVVEKSVELSKMGISDLSSGLLNTLFGTYEVDSKNSDREKFNIYTQGCENGIPHDTILQFRNGVIQNKCSKGLEIEQVLDFVHDKCGIGGLQRKFILKSKCGDEQERDTLIQNIKIVSPCPLGPAQFKVPADTTICAGLEVDDDGILVLPVDSRPQYMEPDSRGWEIEYKYVIVYSPDHRDLIHVERIWTYADTCSNDTLVLTQNLELIDTCGGEYIMALEREERGQIIRVSKKGQEVSSFMTDEEGRIRMDEPDIIEWKGDQLNTSRPMSTTVAYPNPFTKNVILEFEPSEGGLVEIRILDMQGRQVYSEKYEMDSGAQQIILTEEKFREPGMYNIQVIEKDETWNKKVLFQR